MKFTLIFWTLAILLSSCNRTMKDSNVILSNFPLEVSRSFPSDETIKSLAVSDTWLAIFTTDQIKAIDIQTGNTLWNIDFSVSEFGFPEFKIVNDILVASSRDEIIIVNKSGQKSDVNLAAKGEGINRLVAIYPDYIYVIRGSDWMLEAYDIRQNNLLWKLDVGRGGTDVFYDMSKNIAYVTTRDYSIQAINNATGEILWKQEQSALHSAFQSGILYMVGRANENAFQFFAFDAQTHKTLWEKDIKTLKEIYQLTIVDKQLLVSGTGGLVALDTSNGDELWHTDIGETFYARPVLFDNIIYAKGPSLKVYAISPKDGTPIGFIRLEEPKYLFQPGYETRGKVHAIKDGIIVNTRNAVVILKNR